MGKGSRYFPSATESQQQVTVKPATDNDLRDALHGIGIIDLGVHAPVKKIAEKFHNEICCGDNNLAWDECTHKGFFTFEIVSPT